MSGTLFVVATPIGNLEDITLRALRVLREATVIAAEDTRRTGKLLAHYSISKKTVSFHEHNARTRVPQLIAWLEAGDDVAVVTDAGTPGVSDPGVQIVDAAVKKGIAVDPVPGACAPLTALIGSGFPVTPFTMFGFAPNRLSDRNKWWAVIGKVDHTLSFFEAPHRIRATLSEAAHHLGERQISLARELTKLHQQFIRGSAMSLANREFDGRGEFTVVVGPNDKCNEDSVLEMYDAIVASEFCYLTTTKGLNRRAAISSLAQKYGRSSREVYSAVERGKLIG